MNIKRLVKKSSIFSKIYYFILEYKNTVKMKRYLKLRVDNQKILFATTEGRYNDSNKAMAEYIHKNYKCLRLVWVYRHEEFLNDFPDYIYPVKYESEEFYKEMSTSAVWVFNYLLPQGVIKKKEQLYIQVWHGDKAIKKFANDAIEDNENYRKGSNGRKFLENELCDYMTVGCSSFIPIWQSAVGYNGKFINKGLPRNDILMERDEKKQLEIKERLGIESDVSVILYAPTFRDHRLDNGDTGSNIDLMDLVEHLESSSEHNWICLLRAHGGKRLRRHIIGEDQTEKFLDVTTYSDMNDLMLISDILITDYSSCAGDFALSNKAVILYHDDIESFTNNDRKLYFKMENTPFFIAHNMLELYNIIDNLNDDKITNNCRQILNFYGSTQTNRSTEECCRVIAQFLKLSKNE